MPSQTSQRVPDLLRVRVQRALGRRIWPQTDLHRKVVAGAIGIHGETFNKLMRGEGDASGPVLDALVRFFHARGDHLFAFEVFGIAPPSADPVADAVADLKALVQRLEAVPA